MIKGSFEPVRPVLGAEVPQLRGEANVQCRVENIRDTNAGLTAAGTRPETSRTRGLQLYAVVPSSLWT